MTEQGVSQDRWRLGVCVCVCVCQEVKMTRLDSVFYDLHPENKYMLHLTNF